MKNTSAYAVLTRFGIIAAILATLVFIAPATSAQSASECTGSNPVKCTYDENGTDPVATFQAEDEDTEDFTFALKAVDDHGSFAIGATSGVLSFKKPPNFEAKSSYKVTVTTSAGGEHKVEITINNVEETGKVSFTGNLQPQVGQSLRASVTDGDTGVYNQLWQWSRSTDKENWTEIATARASLYTPGDDDVDHYLRATVTYRDALGSETETAMGMTEFKVEAEPAANRRPEFPDQDLETAGVQNTQVVREVDENSGNGTSVGEPVAAFDRDPGDSLLYSLGDVPSTDTTPGASYVGSPFTVGSTIYTSAEDDGDVFGINVTTGQITVKDKTKLDFEAATGVNDDDAFVVRVTATDPSGAAGSITVIITVKDVNEKPAIGDAVTATVTNLEAVTIEEENTAIAVGGTALAFTADDPDIPDENNTASDGVKWSTAGPDGGKFSIAVDGTGAAARAVLTFKKAPSFEAMGDADKDNVYEVDVVAASGDVSDKKRVKVTITDIEETGSIARMSQLQPVTGIPIVALGHSDKDGGVKNRSWSWYRGTTFTGTPPDARIVSGAGGSTGALVAGLLDCSATGASADTAPCKVASGSASYTPVDDDATYTLYAVVQYTDGHDDDDSGTDVNEAVEYVVLGSEHPSVERLASNGRPAFIDQDTETAGIQNTETTREVDEGKKGKSAGDAVLATDPDSQPLLYSLGGADKDYFAINRKSAEITSNKDLDYESLPEDAKHYMVTVIATDPYGASASIAVTINVKDVNEDAKIVPAEQDSASECTGSKPVKCTYDENGTDPVARFEAEDEDTEDFTFALKAVDDHGSFNVGATSGVLSFKKPPNFEAKSSYKVTVTTSAGGEHAVEITINNVEETGKVTFTGNLQPQVGRSLRASVTDGDGGEYNELWQWSRSSDMETWTEIATARASLYTPGDDDVDHYLQARVTYRDALGSETETAMGMTEFKVEAEPAANRRPEFPDQDLETAGVQNTQVVREVAENSAKGASVGEPVAAFDRDPGDSLLYSLGDYPDATPDTTAYDTTDFTVGSTTYTSAEGDGDLFDINVTTGQITVKDKSVLDFEATDTSFVVRVTATDPSGAAGHITVIITVTDVDEKPVIGDVTGGGDDTNAATNPDTSDAPIKIDEGTTAITVGTDGAVRFTANSPDIAGDDDTAHADVKWSTAGPDGGKFKITVPAAGEDNAGTAVLTFDKAPSFESPGDADKDNIYEVDVVATYKDASDKKRVRIEIEDIEETGKIDRMSQLQPVTGIPIVALGHSDGDGSIRNRSWSWYRGTTFTGSPPDARIVSGAGGSTGALVAGLLDCSATGASADTAPCKVASGSASYTPVDDDDGYTLYAVVQYTDGHDDSDPDVEGDETQEYVVLGSEYPSVKRLASNGRPAFIDQDTETAGIQNTETTREVDEGKKGKSAGDAVLATDPDSQPLLYSLGGADKGYFTIDRKSAEIKSGKDLDYESLPEDAKHYMVMVIATDPYGASASIAVTINVKDVNEDAKIVLASGTGGAPEPEHRCVVGGAVTAAQGANMAADCLTLLEGMEELIGDGTATLNWSDDLAIGEWNGIAQRGTGRVGGIHLTGGHDNLGGGQLAGTIPASFNTLIALERLTLSNNDLTGEIPDLSDLDNLEWLVLGGNNFSGAIPTTLADMDGLIRLWLHRNEGGFEGGIPAELGSLPKLRYLMLYGNGLTGEIPTELGSLSNLKALYLHDNMLSGEIPAELGNLVDAKGETARLVYLHNNMLTGDVPAELGNLVSLTRILLSGNMLTGCIPAAIIDAADDAEAAGLMACAADDGNGNGDGS